MPVYTVEGPDGKRYKIEGPAGATVDQLAAVITNNKPAAPAMNVDPTDGMSALEKFAAGYGKAGSDVVRGVRQYLPDAIGGLSADDLAESKRLDQALQNTTAGKAGNIVGSIVNTVPMALSPGANTIVGGAAYGALMGALTPEESGIKRLQNIGVGGGLGGAVPALFTAAKVGKSMLDPLYQSGRDKIVGNALRSAAGSDADMVVNNLRNSAPVVPGSFPTVGQSANNAGIAAMERTASAIDPSVANAFARRQADNNAARIAVLDGVSGAEGRLASALASRESQAASLYGNARSAGVSQEALQPEFQAALAQLNQRIPDDVKARALKLAKLEGVALDNTTSVQGLHWMKQALDAEISMAKRAGDNTMAKAYTGLQKQLLGALDVISPEYTAAREAFSAASKPITEMKIGQAIADRSINPLTGNVTPAAFARAFSDRTAQGVSKMPGATLESSMSPEALRSLGNLKTDLQSMNFANTAGRGVGSDTVQKLAYSNMLDRAGVPAAMRSFGAAGVVGNLAQKAGNVIYSDGNKKIAEQLAMAMLNPKEAADLMAKATTRKGLLAIENAVRRAGIEFAPMGLLSTSNP